MVSEALKHLFRKDDDFKTWMDLPTGQSTNQQQALEARWLNTVPVVCHVATKHEFPIWQERAGEARFRQD